MQYAITVNGNVSILFIFILFTLFCEGDTVSYQN